MCALTGYYTALRAVGATVVRAEVRGVCGDVDEVKNA